MMAHSHTFVRVSPRSPHTKCCFFSSLKTSGAVVISNLSRMERRGLKMRTGRDRRRSTLVASLKHAHAKCMASLFFFAPFNCGSLPLGLSACILLLRDWAAGRRRAVQSCSQQKVLMVCSCRTDSALSLLLIFSVSIPLPFSDFSQSPLLSLFLSSFHRRVWTTSHFWAWCQKNIHQLLLKIFSLLNSIIQFSYLF